MSTQPWLDLERSLFHVKDAWDKLNHFVKSVMEGDFYETILAVQRYREEDLNRRTAAIDALIETNKKIDENLKLANEKLEKSEGRLTDKEKKLAREILKLQGELITKPFEDAYNAKFQDHEQVKITLAIVQRTLADIRNGIDNTTKDAQQYLKVLSKSATVVECSHLKGSSYAFANNKPLTVEIHSRWAGITFITKVEWTPGTSITVLYETIGLGWSRLQQK